MTAPRSRPFGVILLLAASVGLGLTIILVAARLEGGRPRSIVLLFSALSAAAGFAVLGVRALPLAGAEPGDPDYRHLVLVRGDDGRDVGHGARARLARTRELRPRIPHHEPAPARRLLWALHRVVPLLPRYHAGVSEDRVAPV